MINPGPNFGGGKVEVFSGAFHIPDFENPEHHDGSLVHYRDMIDMSDELGIARRIGGHAHNVLVRTAVTQADKERLSSRFKAESIGGRLTDWRYNFAHPSSEVDLRKRVRLFLTNELAADTFYDHVLRTSSTWPSQYLDVIEALLKARGHERPSEKREVQLARRRAMP